MFDPRSERLKGLLEAYVTEDHGELQHARRMLALLDSASPFSRGQFEPGHFTASSFVLAPEGGALLLIHHARLGRWLQPGGHVEATDADLFAAARRELAEEVGISDAALERPGIFDIDVHPIPQHRAEPAHEHFDVRFLFRARNKTFVINDEARAARWVSFAEIGPGQDESVLRAVRKLQRGLPGDSAALRARQG